MKTPIILAASAFAMAAAAGLLFWQAGWDFDRSPAETKLEIARIKREFVETHKPVASIPISKLVRTRASAELSDPKTALPQSHLFPFAQIAALAKYAETCSGSEKIHPTSPELRKALLWHKFKCGEAELPKDFFNTKPFMHPAGSSYAALAGKIGEKEKYQPNLHLTEVLKFSSAQVQSLLNEEDTVFTPNWILFRIEKSDASHYTAYSIMEWNRFVSTRDFVTGPNRSETACLFEEPGACWYKNSDQGRLRTRTIALLLSLSFLILTALLALEVWRRRQMAAQETAKRLFTLQMLTHELRTPATALKLSLETLRSQFDHLPSDSQRAFLRICEELQRLERTIDASKNYLASESAFHAPESSTSVNQLLSSILEIYGEQVTLQPLPIDQPFRVRRYWVELCLKNLIDNAISHGRAPVSVSANTEGGQLTIAVQDVGTTTFTSLDDMTQPFQRGQTSRGLGLGLAIVRQVVQSMNGELLYQSNPTTFSIKLKDFS